MVKITKRGKNKKTFVAFRHNGDTIEVTIRNLSWEPIYHNEAPINNHKRLRALFDDLRKYNIEFEKLVEIPQDLW